MLLQLDIVIELDADQVDARQAFRHFVRPAAGIGQVADGNRRLAALGRGLDPEAECRTAVVTELDRLEPQTVDTRKG